ncbi:hypothetical protein HYT05_01350 [Candidatus Kaiserbacteria bacterium]|nr:hypothetical protein [Candidatus Kaiserbacteria bacterium]
MAKERWSDRGEMPELECEKVSAQKSFRPWKIEDVARLKARVPFCTNGWNTCSKALNSFGAAVCFIFVLALSAPQVRNIFGLEEATAPTLSLSLLVVALIFVVVAEWKKAWPPRWVSRSLGDFCDANGESAAIPEFEAFLSSLTQDASLDIPLWSPYEIEWCDKVPIIILWRHRYSRVTIGAPPAETTKLVCKDKVPLAVFDFTKKKTIDPSSL